MHLVLYFAALIFVTFSLSNPYIKDSAKDSAGGTSNPASGQWNECGDSDDFCIRYERKFHLRQNETGFSNGVCVIVRTYTKQGLQLRTQMHAWNIIAEWTQRHVHVFLVDTDPDDSREQGVLFLERVVPVEGKTHAHIVRLGAKFVLDKGLYR